MGKKKALGELVLSSAGNVTGTISSRINNIVCPSDNAIHSSILFGDLLQNDANFVDSPSDDSSEFDMEMLEVDNIFS